MALVDLYAADSYEPQTFSMAPEKAKARAVQAKRMPDLHGHANPAYEEVIDVLGRLDAKARQARNASKSVAAGRIAFTLAIACFAMAFLALLVVAALLSQNEYGYVIPAGFAAVGLVLLGLVNLAFLRAKRLLENRG